MEQEMKLTNVHEALAKAGSEPQSEAMKTHGFRAPNQLVIEAGEICERHGTTVGAFIRECLRGLVDDYQQP